MKNLCIIIIVLLVMGCPTYDPPNGVLSIKNTSSETVYVYLTCGITLPETPELKLYLNIGDNVFDEVGNKVKDTIYYPNYRIEPDSIGFLRVHGTPDQPKIPCDAQNINLFFITESVMQEHTWEEIAKNQFYQTKLQVTKEQLDTMDWKIKYR